MSKKNAQKETNLLRTRRDLLIFLDEQLWYTTVLLPLANPTPPDLCHISRLGYSEAHWGGHARWKSWSPCHHNHEVCGGLLDKSGGVSYESHFAIIDR